MQPSLSYLLWKVSSTAQYGRFLHHNYEACLSSSMVGEQFYMSKLSFQVISKLPGWHTYSVNLQIKQPYLVFAVQLKSPARQCLWKALREERELLSRMYKGFQAQKHCSGTQKMQEGGNSHLCKNNSCYVKVVMMLKEIQKESKGFS